MDLPLTYRFMPRKNDLISLIPIYLATFLYVLVSVQVYVFLQDSISKGNAYNTVQAVGAIVLGYASDKLCRRKICLFTHAAGLGLFLLMFLFPGAFFFTLLFGFAYNPLPILLAGLVDNLPGYSKVKLISFSFAVQFVPWCFYDKFVLFEKNTAIYLSFAALLISLAIVWLLFFDKRDKIHGRFFHLNFRRFIHPEAKRRFLYTVFAFFPAQLVYFFSENLIATYSENPLFYSIISLGSVIGALVSALYKKTPHASALTINYGINMILATIPIACLYIYDFKEISIPLQFMIFATLGGFGIPFVYDIILNAVDGNFRGTACGLLDFIYSASSFVNLFLFGFFNIHLLLAFSTIAVCFAISTGLQKRTE